MILDFLSRRRCDDKVMIEISFAYSVRLISDPHHVLVCLSLACVVRAPHSVNTRDSQVHHSYRLLMLSKTCSPNAVTARHYEVINIYQTQMNNAVFVSESPQARFHERFFAPHVSKIGRQHDDTIFLER